MTYRVIEGAEHIDADDVCALLKETYWASDRPRDVIKNAMEHSVCYSLTVDGEEHLAGFARVITDYATTWYLCDVVISPRHRGKGLGTALVRHVVSREIFRSLRGFLITRDAHGLYRKFGFETVDGRVMMRIPGKTEND